MENGLGILSSVEPTGLKAPSVRRNGMTIAKLVLDQRAQQNMKSVTLARKMTERAIRRQSVSISG